MGQIRDRVLELAAGLSTGEKHACEEIELNQESDKALIFDRVNNERKHKAGAIIKYGPPRYNFVFAYFVRDVQGVTNSLSLKYISWILPVVEGFLQVQESSVVRGVGQALCQCLLGVTNSPQVHVC